jgi:hypothetical protein
MQTTEPIWLQEDPPVHVSFNSGGYTLYRGARGVLGTPPEAYLRLFAVRGEEKREVASPAALQGLVRIDDPAQALDFVRLFTSLDTHSLFPSLEMVEPRLASGPPRAGEYAGDYARQAGLSPASARGEGDAFIVEQNLLERSGALHRVTSRVGRDGGSSELSRRVIDAHSPVSYPIFQ